jgi:hypothetical protein
MKLAELQHALRATDPAAVLVSPRVLERVIQEVYKLPTLLWQVPHAKSCVVDRQVLFRHVEQEELDLESDRLLPTTVILLRRPTTEQLNALESGDLLLKYWRLLFHANIHRELTNRRAVGKLEPEDVGARIEDLGLAEFEEIRSVLVQDGYLMTDADERAVYTEFAALFLELRHFAPGLLPAYFPAIDDLGRIEPLLARDVDAVELLARTRLPDAPGPTSQPPERSDEAHEFYWKLMKAAEYKARAGNLVHAAILRMRAGRVAPPALAFGTRAEAQADLQKLMVRLQAALQMSDDEAAEWMKDLPALLDKADQGSNPVEAALLYDLQKVCLDHERDIYALDLMDWLMSGGHRSIKRPLPGLRLVRVTRHLRSAAQRLTLARISEADRQHLAGLLEGTLRRCEQGLRTRFRPVLTTALQDVGLHPANPLERTAFHKIVEELLERITAQGFLTFGDLRDAISRNQLKLPDLPDPEEFIHGDPLLRLDRRLATLLDGIYRPSAIYMRLLERFTALNFGTKTGRWLTRYVTLPFGGAFVAWEGLKIVMHWFGAPPPPLAVNLGMWLVLAAFLLGLLHSATVRRTVTELGRLTGRPFHKLFVDVPLWLVRWPLLRRAVASWPFQLFYWYLFKPLLACALLWLFWPQYFQEPLHAVGIFAAVNLLLNTRAGHAAQELVRQSFVSFVELLRAGLLPGLIQLVLYVFKRAIELVETVLFTVDEWLRFRSDAGPGALTVRAILGLVWYPVSYVVQFFLVVLIEPGYNPVKAPVCYLAAKFMAPLNIWAMAQLTQMAAEWDLAVRLLVYPLASVTIFHLPDVFGFLFWEMKENWSLYRANRPRVLRPVVVGGHGETMRRLLQPGFHSGTVPRLYARLRRAEARALMIGNRRDVRAVRHALRETASAVRLFVEGELVSLVEQAFSWQNQGLSVGKVALASKRFRIALTHASYPDAPVELEFEAHAGWLVAGLGDAGWLGQLSPEQARALTTGLAILYKLAGVDLVREQLQANLPPGTATYDLTSEGLVLWRERRLGGGAVYNLRDRTGRLKPYPVGTASGIWPVSDRKRLVFADLSLTWDQCVRCWEQDRSGSGHPQLLGPAVQLLPPRGTAAAATTPAPPEATTRGNGVARGETASVPDGLA